MIEGMHLKPRRKPRRKEKTENQKRKNDKKSADYFLEAHRIHSNQESPL